MRPLYDKSHSKFYECVQRGVYSDKLLKLLAGESVELIQHIFQCGACYNEYKKQFRYVQIVN